MAKLPWYMKEKNGKINFHWLWILFIQVKEILKKYTNGIQR